VGGCGRRAQGNAGAGEARDAELDSTEGGRCGRLPAQALVEHERGHRYGTALLSRVPFTDSLDHAFRPSPPSMTKGLTLGQVAWRPDGKAGPIYVDIVSVHLDFSRDSVRKQQVAEMSATRSDRTHPMIVLGDFSSDWSGNDSVVTELAHRCGMQVYQPLADDLGTYPSSGRRLDWVLTSDDLAFLHHEVLPHRVSDHHAVVAIIGLKAMNDSAQAEARGSSRCTE